jgi:hypothetical protein
MSIRGKSVECVLVRVAVENIRPRIPPSEFLAGNALRLTLPDYLLVSPENASLAKFIADRQDTVSMKIFRLAG